MAGIFCEQLQSSVKQGHATVLGCILVLPMDTSFALQYPDFEYALSHYYPDNKDEFRFESAQALLLPEGENGLFP